MPDQNGWSRYLHFEAAWVLVLTGLVYAAACLCTAHFSKNLLPPPADRRWSAFREVFAKYLRRASPDEAEGRSYNVVQRTAYLVVIFVLFPLVIWTGLALSPAFDSAVPAVRAHPAFLRVRISRVFSRCPHRDDYSCRLLESHAGHDYRACGTTLEAHMSNISRRRLITTGLAATAGVAGLATAHLARRYGLIPPDNLRCPTPSHQTLAGPRIPPQHDFQGAICQPNRPAQRSL